MPVEPQVHSDDFRCRSRRVACDARRVSAPIHDDEPDTGEHVARALLRAECPQWAESPLEYVGPSGTDNAMWRVRCGATPDVVVRLPRRTDAIAKIDREALVLRRLAGHHLGDGIATPRLRHLGSAQEVFPHPWCVLEWIDGADAWTARAELGGQPSDRRRSFAEQLAGAVTAIGALDPDGLDPRPVGARGGPIDAIVERLDAWLDDPQWHAAELIDVDAVRRAADDTEVVGAAANDDRAVNHRTVHGDLIPSNLLVDGGRLTAVLDWGGVGVGDPAQDLAPAWAVLDADQRAVFRATVGVDDDTWRRGRTFELEHAVGGILYYVPRRHPLGDIMTRTLRHVLDDARAER